MELLGRESSNCNFFNFAVRFSVFVVWPQAYNVRSYLFLYTLTPTKRDMHGIYYYITTEFDYPKCDSLVTISHCFPKNGKEINKEFSYNARLHNHYTLCCYHCG